MIKMFAKAITRGAKKGIQKEIKELAVEQAVDLTEKKTEEAVVEVIQDTRTTLEKAMPYITIVSLAIAVLAYTKKPRILVIKV